MLFRNVFIMIRDSIIRLFWWKFVVEKTVQDITSCNIGNKFNENVNIRMRKCAAMS